jgi:hypothetical protein
MIVRESEFRAIGIKRCRRFFPAYSKNVEVTIRKPSRQLSSEGPFSIKSDVALN